MFSSDDWIYQYSGETFDSNSKLARKSSIVVLLGDLQDIDVTKSPWTFEPDLPSTNTPRKPSIAVIIQDQDTELSKSPWIFKTILPSFISSSVSTYLEYSPLFTLVVFPVAQFITGTVFKRSPLDRMQSALSAIYSLVYPRSASGTPLESGCAGLLKELVLAQEKTMFYTVTVNAALPTKDLPKKPSPNLKWQCASALSRSQSVIQRTNSNSALYYTLTFLGDFDSSSIESSISNQQTTPQQLNSDSSTECSNRQIL